MSKATLPSPSKRPKPTAKVGPTAKVVKTAHLAAARAEAGLLEAVRDMRAGRAVRVFVPDGKGGMVASDVARARMASGLTQQKFASLLGVSPRTLQEWEQGRKRPSGAARTLLKIAGINPQALLAVAEQ